MSSASAYRASGERTSPLQRGSVHGGSGGHKAGGKGRWVPGCLRAGSPGTGSRRRLSPRLEPPRAGMGVKGEVWTVELGHALQFRPGWPEHIANEACGVRVTGPVPGAPRGRALPGSRGPGRSREAHRRRGHGWPRSVGGSPPSRGPACGGSAWLPGDFKK